MEQRWTIDRYDEPSGDLEFWALRRGKVPHAVNQNERGHVPTRRCMMRTGVAVLVAVALGVALA
ncbi:MAG: hypothetical protein M3Y43_13120 [Pseudomonadota bacterium]|nr:hypothetical protein [Pseudomonadota bacterium]